MFLSNWSPQLHVLANVVSPSAHHIPQQAGLMLQGRTFPGSYGVKAMGLVVVRHQLLSGGWEASQATRPKGCGEM